MTPRDWELIIVSFLTLSVLWSFAGFIAGRQLDRNDRLTDRVAEVSIATDALLCLASYTPSDVDTRAEFMRYIQDNVIIIDDPVCQTVVDLARQMVNGEMPTPTVEDGR